jgi:hypothetical protein
MRKCPLRGGTLKPQLGCGLNSRHTLIVCCGTFKWSLRSLDVVFMKAATTSKLGLEGATPLFN